MFMLGFNKTIDQLAMSNSVRWYGHVLRREDGHVLRRALDFEVEGQRKNGRLKQTWKKQVGGESVKVDLRREDALCQSNQINQIAAGLRLICLLSLIGKLPDFKYWCLSLMTSISLV